MCILHLPKKYKIYTHTHKIWVLFHRWEVGEIWKLQLIWALRNCKVHLDGLRPCLSTTSLLWELPRSLCQKDRSSWEMIEAFQEKRKNAGCHRGFLLHLEKSRLAAGMLCELWIVEICPVKAKKQNVWKAISKARRLPWGTAEEYLSCTVWASNGAVTMHKEVTG